MVYVWCGLGSGSEAVCSVLWLACATFGACSDLFSRGAFSQKKNWEFPGTATSLFFFDDLCTRSLLWKELTELLLPVRVCWWLLNHFGKEFTKLLLPVRGC